MAVSARLDAVELVWRRQKLWSRTADRGKARVERQRRTALIALLVGAVAGTAAAQLSAVSRPAATTLAVVAALAVGAGAFVRGRTGTTASDDWATARSVSEALKAQVFLYLSGVAPYHGTAHRRLLDDTNALCAKAGNQLTNDTVLGTVEPLPEIDGVDSYVTSRLTGHKGQIAYFRGNADRYVKTLGRYRVLETILGAAAAALLAFASVVHVDALTAWIGVVTTVAAALAAHSAQAEYEFLVAEYRATADLLEELVADRAALTEHEFVAACERVLSRQNESWLRRLGSETPEKDQ
ncbi:DUF4231 domain-containing protein [Amycolatopsis azurea]|uniref:SMODS and SLOG-associating 2TM effector domain-containing protein n=1 Tax=Amycolatopsis azurea DSM 43854 TaxID=1238180 RepID=A0ABX3J3M3_9PSEU|nr:DUF4231 domain-containing protein [Amycolatopsis azurea]OOC02280.1 hypothetical protein B0293_33135 [Amycolatopsis azurea DSM 43854]